jgi:hypothetical protein
VSDIFSVRSMDLNHPKNLLLAVLLTTVGAIVIFILSRALFINQDFVGSIYENGIPRSLAGFSLLSFPYIHQRLAGKRRIHFSHLPDDVVPLQAYTLPWHIVLVYGVLIAFAIAGVSLFLVWLVGVATGFFVTRAILILNLIILFVTFYHLGAWIGSRSARNPFLAAVGAVLGYAILELLVTLLLNIDSPLRSLFGLVIFLSLSLVAALIGALLGKRRRLINYIRFLLTPLPPQDRQTVVNNLYREVKQRTSDEH